ncbi:hypothetical protein KXV85_003283, partial [Aspergillus fumigatus]
AAGWRVFKDDILAYWVGPGLAEIRLYDDLRRGGVDVQLYPRDDAADVGRAHELGIDVKSYACPRLLGDTLSERLGGLTTFDERYVAIPDAIVNRRPGYLEDLRYAYRGSTSVVFGKPALRAQWMACVMHDILGLRSLAGAPALFSGYRSIVTHPALAEARVALRNLRLLGVNIESEAHLQEA